MNRVLAKAGRTVCLGTVFFSRASGPSRRTRPRSWIGTPSPNEVTSTSATIVWHTHRLTSSTFGYGTDPENPDGWNWIHFFARAPHAVTLTDLAPNTVYYYGAGEGGGRFPVLPAPSTVSGRRRRMELPSASSRLATREGAA